MDEIKSAPPACPWQFIATACAAAPTLQLRPAQSVDEPWQRQLFASLRGLEPAMLAACPALLEQQWQLQQRAFMNDYPGARTRIIWSAGRAIGVITLHQGTSAWRLLEIGLEPDCRGQGIGERLLQGLTRFADSQGQTLELAVMRHNLALRLYQRLGFVTLAESEAGIQLQMRREPI
ncbi:MAG: GNAT family N-acetyltransferase [Pseudomonas sp.]|uniref:GNAT family N-acetyltransferase n=1 Tax=Pseudomonas sp. TaxID=306 RepID=UPI003BB7E94D